MNNEIPKEGYKVECPRPWCRSKGLKKIISYSDGSDNIDGMPHYHLECPECGIHFNEWGWEKQKVIEALKKLVPGSWEKYV